MAWHQDQMIQPTTEAEVIGHTDFCANAMLSYDDTALTVQPHPEFTAAFMADLLAAGGEILPPDIARAAVENVSDDLATSDMADLFAAFFKRPRQIQCRRTS
ncbi:hypothetical protein ACN2XU_23550 [Primorskyibacter sp. 2E107]|uniref:hypothetical protein n=1 Tax=Primorskyibacter sp. 2E107 TaxID=3403458 RepID=UPI003AF87D83